MLQNTTPLQYVHEGDMNAGKSWLAIPYNYFYVLVYAALGVSLAVQPGTRITQEVAEFFPFLSITPAAVGRIVGTVFLLMSFVIWQSEPKGAWILRSLLPVALWGCVTIVSILGNPTATQSSGVFVMVALGALVYNGELRLTLANNESLNESLIKENLALKEALKNAPKAADEPRPTQPTV